MSRARQLNIFCETYFLKNNITGKDIRAMMA